MASCTNRNRFDSQGNSLDRGARAVVADAFGLELGDLVEVAPPFDSYIVHRSGRVFSTRGRKPREMSSRGSTHYARVWLCCAHQRSEEYVHRLVAKAFLPEPPEGHTIVRHLNDVRDDNRAENLAWGTQADNVRDARRNWSLRGGKHPNTKLTDDAVLELRRRVSKGESVSAHDEAERLGVDVSRIHAAIAGRSFKHLPGARDSNGRAKLTDEAVEVLRARAATASVPLMDLCREWGEKYGVHEVTVWSAIKGRSFKHLPGALSKKGGE